MAMSTNMSRRNFLAAAGAAALATSGAAAAMAAPVLDVPQQWDEEHEIVVIGGGVGLAAALTAAEVGADVVLYEKGDHVGGLFMTAGGQCTMGGGNAIQQEFDEEDDLESWYEAEMFACDYRGVPEVVHTLCEHGVETVQWLCDMGMQWSLTAGVLGGPVQRGLWPEQNPGVYVGGKGTPNSGICWTSLWQKYLDQKNVPLLVNHRMINLYRDGDGPVVGVELETPDGIKNVKATKGVILCTGTWTDNDRMTQAYDPRLVGDDCFGDGGIPAENLLFVDSSGDGHIAASKIGGMLSDMSFTSYVYLFWGSRSYWGWGEDPVDWTSNAACASGKGLNTRNAELFNKCILVKGDGTRYINEASYVQKFGNGHGSLTENPENPFTAAYLALPQPRNVWMIGDATAAADLGWPLAQIENPNPRVDNMFDPALVAIADTLEELAAKMGVDAEGLKATVESYNAAVGAQDEFGKTVPQALATAPFYGFKTSVVRHTQRNGLRVNTKMQVIDGWAQIDDCHKPVAIDDEAVIPHLYAAGELGNVFGWRRCHNSLGHYATAARLCAWNAAAEEPLA